MMCPTQRMISEIDCRNPLDGVKKLISSTFVPKGRVDFRRFRIRAVKPKGTCLDNNELRDNPGSRKPWPLAVDECASFWPGCRPTRASVRCHRLCPWGSTNKIGHGKGPLMIAVLSFQFEFLGIDIEKGIIP